MRHGSTFWRAYGIFALAVSALFASSACGGGSSSSPSPSPTGGSNLSGVITDIVTMAAVSGATVAVQGRSVTTGADGRYSITGLSDGSATLTVQHQGHRNATQTLTIAGATTRDIRMLIAPEVRASGPWTGSWANQTRGTSGPINMTLTVNTVAQTMTMTLRVDGAAFGRSGPLTDTITGPYSPTTGANFTTSSSIFGNVTFTWLPNGAGMNGSAVGVPGGVVSRVDFLGELESPDLDLILTMRGDLTFANGSKGTNSVTLTCARRTSQSSCS